MAVKRDKGFDRIRPRVDGAASGGPRPDPQGRQALFTDSPDIPAMGAVTVTCSSCGQTSALNLRQAAMALLPSAHLPLLRKDHPSFLRCPACKKLTWVKVGLQI
jgi:uncharacterized protein with PIN domain